MKGRNNESNDDHKNEELSKYIPNYLAREISIFDCEFSLYKKFLYNTYSIEI